MPFSSLLVDIVICTQASSSPLAFLLDHLPTASIEPPTVEARLDVQCTTTSSCPMIILPCMSLSYYTACCNRQPLASSEPTVGSVNCYHLIVPPLTIARTSRHHRLVKSRVRAPMNPMILDNLVVGVASTVLDLDQHVDEPAGGPILKLLDFPHGRPRPTDLARSSRPTHPNQGLVGPQDPTHESHARQANGAQSNNG